MRDSRSVLRLVVVGGAVALAAIVWRSGVGVGLSGAESARAQLVVNVLSVLLVLVSAAAFYWRRAWQRERMQRRRLEHERTRDEALERRELEARKLEALGTFAGGIAHEFNNALVSVLGYGEMLGERFAPESEERADLEVMLQAAERARDLVVQILTFCRKARVKVRPVEVESVVANAVGLVRASFDCDAVEVRLRTGDHSHTILADPGQLEQLVLQLGRNAADAVKEHGGVVDIEVGEAEIDDEARARDMGLEPGRYVVLTVRDTGHGMDSDTRMRCFEPFYTTKGPGEGTGLGLSVVHGIVSSYGGAIEVDSSRGKGSTFKVYLPAAEAEQVCAKQGPTESGRGQRILLVEDDPNNARLAERILERAGYDVTYCALADDALAYLEPESETPYDFDLLVTDLTMPGVSGLELVRRLRNRDPGAPAIVVTGHNDVDTEQDVLDVGALELVAKPFSRDEFLRAVARALDGSASSSARSAA